MLKIPSPHTDTNTNNDKSTIIIILLLLLLLVVVVLLLLLLLLVVVLLLLLLLSGRTWVRIANPPVFVVEIPSSMICTIPKLSMEYVPYIWLKCMVVNIPYMVQTVHMGLFTSNKKLFSFWIPELASHQYTNPFTIASGFLDHPSNQSGFSWILVDYRKSLKHVESNITFLPLVSSFEKRLQ